MRLEKVTFLGSVLSEWPLMHTRRESQRVLEGEIDVLMMLCLFPYTHLLLSRTRVKVLTFLTRTIYFLGYFLPHFKGVFPFDTCFSISKNIHINSTLGLSEGYETQ